MLSGRLAGLVLGALLLVSGSLMLKYRRRITDFWVRQFGDRAEDISFSAQTLGPVLLVVGGIVVLLAAAFGS